MSPKLIFQEILKDRKKSMSNVFEFCFLNWLKPHKFHYKLKNFNIKKTWAVLNCRLEAHVNGP